MTVIYAKPRTLEPPSNDKRWKIIIATMRRLGYSPHALIETLHAVQRTFGYIDLAALEFVARSLKVPLSKAYGVATFYSIFRMKPEGKHTCVICLGTACYIKGAAKLLETAERRAGIRIAETTDDGKLSLLSARCIGACGIAPAVVFDGTVRGEVQPENFDEQICKYLSEDA